MADDIAKLGFSVDTRGLKKGERGLQSFANQGQKTEKKVSRITQGMSSSFVVLAASIGTVVAALLSMRKIVDITREFDVLNAQLITATGSAENAAQAFKAIQTFAIDTPFQLGEITKGFLQLVNRGLDPSERSITNLGNIAAATGKDFNDLITAVAQAGVGEFESLKTLGFSIKTMQDKLRVTFRGTTTEIDKTGLAVQDFFNKLAEEDFAGAMAERMKTLDGALSNLEDSWDKLFLTISQAGIGDLIEEQVRSAEMAINELSDFIESGQLSASLDLIGMRFSVFGDDIDKMLDGTTDSFITNAGFWNDAIDRFIALSSDSFFNFPENMRAALKILGLEIAHSVQIWLIDFTVFWDKMGISLELFVQNAKSFGEQITNALNPFSDDSFDPIGPFTENIKKAVIEKNNIDVITAEKVFALNTLRAEGITAINEERDAAVASADTQIEAIEKIGIAFKKQREDEKAAGGDALAQFQISGTGGASAGADKQLKDLEKLTSAVDNFGGAWTRTGSTIIDAFGDVADAMEDQMKRMKGIDKLQQRINEERLKDGADLVALGELQQKVDMERVSAELSGIKSLANAGADAFDEKTAASKAFAALSNIIAVTEIALSFQKMAASSAETSVHVANEGTKQSANALTAISSAFAAPFPIGFVAGAAMVAIMANLLGGAFGGGGGGSSVADIQEKQGTGTVFGSDEKSASISKSQDRFEDIFIDQLAELRGIRNSMEAMTSGIQNLTGSIIDIGLSTPGRGLFGAFRSQRETQELFELGNVFGDAPTNESSAQQQVRDIFSNIGDAIVSSAELLGLGSSDALDKALSKFDLDVGEISFEGLSGEEIEAELQAIFSQQADLVAEFLVPGIEKYQEVGEGLFDTLTRVSVEQAVFNDAIENMGFNLSRVSSIIQIDIAQSIIQLTGGIEKFNDLSRSFFDEFFTDAEKLTVLEQSVTDVFDSLGIAMVDTKDEFKELVQGLDLTTKRGQELFAALLEVSPAFAEMIEGMEEANTVASELIRSNADDRIDALMDEQKVLESTASSMRNLAQSINNALGFGLSSTLNLAEALADAQQGDFTLAESLDLNALTNLAATDFSSAEDLAVQTALNRNRLAAIGKLAEEEATEAEKMAALIEEQIDAINSTAEAQINALMGIDATLLMINASIQNSGIPISPAAVARAREGEGAAASLENLTKELVNGNEQNNAFQREIVKNSKSTARLLQRIELDGIDTRPV